MEQPEKHKARVSILNPALTQTLPPYQVAWDADMMAHLFERYFTRTADVGSRTG